jgi:membrane protein DedA with SNARE-associated domain
MLARTDPSHLESDSYILLQVETLTSQLPLLLETVVNKVCALVKESWPRLLFLGALIGSCIHMPRNFFLGVSWGTFLQCFERLSMEDARQRSPSAGAFRSFPQCPPQNRYQLYAAGLLVTGGVLFGPLAGFFAGWCASEELTDYFNQKLIRVLAS